MTTSGPVIHTAAIQIPL